MLHSVVAGAVGTATGMDGFPSGQRGQTVNLLQIASVVRIHLHPFRKREDNAVPVRGRALFFVRGNSKSLQAGFRLL